MLAVVLLLMALVVGWLSTRHGVEGFLSPVAAHNAFIEESQKKLNPLTNMINLTSPVVPIQAVTAKGMYAATYGLKATGTGEEYALNAEKTFEVPDEMPSSLQKAIGCQKAVTTCAAFDDTVFATNCGMSFDQEGAGSDGKPHVGGLFVAPDDRQIQTDRAQKVRETGAPPYDPYKVYQPSIGIAKPGTFALTKDQCVVVKEKVDCLAKQTFGSPNCTQCFPSQGFSRVGPETPRIPSTLYLQGKGQLSVTGPSDVVLLKPTTLRTDEAVTVSLPADFEGKTFMIQFEADGRLPSYVSGYLEGQTGRGAFKIDMNTIIQSDLETQSRPRMSGTSRVNGFRALSFVPGTKRTRMKLACMMPFSFLNMYEPDAMTCDNGPVITKEASATFLESDPCFGKANKPGNYKLECLQGRWVALGGTTEGTGYPATVEKAMALQREGGANGRALILDDIMDTLATKITAAITGKRENGTQMEVPEWNELSMWALGIPIQNPCDGAQKDGGPLSKECLSYLYENRGSGGRLGSTYTLPSSQVASGAGGKEGFADAAAAAVNTYSYPNAPLDPQTATGFAAGQSLGGVEAVKARYDAINRRANDNSKGNTERALDVKQAYGIDLPPPSSSAIPGPTQVYAVGPDYRYTKGEAAGVCAKFGAKVATTAQLEEAQKAGADWCFSGWVADGDGKWPITTNPIPGCGWMGINNWTWQDPAGVPKAGVNCYGPKPRPTDVAPGTINKDTSPGVIGSGVSPAGLIKPFNGDLWDQPTEKTYITVPSGYLESSGPQPACFNGLSPDDAKKGCDRLGGQCVGFSYSKDGGGHGCYKGNHAAGLNGNPGYMGYVKVPSGGGSEPVDGRYIRLDYNHGECLNLAQILVFSAPGGENIITASTPVTKSSGYEGDIFPNQNFVNQKGSKFYNFVHTSCHDVPWIEVDLGSTVRIHKVVVWNRVDCCQSRILGTVLSVLNEEKEKVYIANPIKTTNQSYTWMPPSGEVQVDKDPIRSQKAFTPSDWKCFAGIPAPMRRNEDGEIACMSYNGRDCLWGDDATCKNFLVNANRAAIQPLVCGGHHTQQWGGPGYDNPGHWCARVDTML